jgi:UDP-GlcNAc:undecaprenyl-phosphate GlcNAc-1-phosphate transferase
MPSITIFYILLSALFVVLILVPPITRLAVNLDKVDIPDARKIHSGKIPRLAGIAIFLAVLFSILLFCDITRPVRGFLAGGVIIFATGLYDDLIGLQPRWKLLGEILAALTAVLIGDVALYNLGNLVGTGDIHLGWLAIPFTVLGIVGVTNAINLLDGLDGLAGGISAIAAVALSLLAYLAGNQQLLYLLVALLGAILGFLKFNTYPARIFMGDSGSLFIGYSLALFAVILCGGTTSHISAVTPLLILVVPIVDTFIVMFNRWRRGLSLSSPDNSHIHHRLLGVGFGHKATVIILYTLSYLMAIIAIALSRLPDYQQLGFLVPIVLILAFLHRYINPQMLDGLPVLRSDESLRQSPGYRLLFHYSGKLLSLVKYLVLVVVLLAILLPADLSTHAPIVALLLLLLSLTVLVMTRDWGNPFLYFIIYVDGAYLLFLLENFGRTSHIAGFSLLSLSHALFLLLLLCCGLRLYIDRRSRNLMHSPLEYLLFFLVVSVPLLPAEFLQRYDLLTVMAKTVILFAAYRMVQLRKGRRHRRVVVVTLLTLLVVAVKGYL